MQSDIDVDLEELESRLYSQVFHSNQVYEQEQTNLVPNNTDSTNRHISTYTISNISNSKRYFGDKQVAEAPQQKAHPKSTIITRLETIDCSGNREQNATDINKQSLNDATSAISKKQKKKMRKAKQRAANKKLTNDTVMNPVNQARNGHSYNLRSANNQQPIDPWQLFIPTEDKAFSDLRIQGHEACYGLPLVKNASQLILSNTRQPEKQIIEMVHNQQFYDVRQSANQASHVPPLMGMVDGQQIFNIQSANQAGHTPPLMGLVVNRPANQTHPPPLMGIVGNQQFGDSIKTGNQSEHVSPFIVNLVDDQQFDSESHEPPTKNVSFYDSKWASIKMPISKQDFGLPDLSCTNQVTPASGPSVVNETMLAHCITNQNVAVNSEKLIFQNLNLPQQSPTFATISSKCNPISQFESDIKYLNDYITNLNDIVDLYPDGPQSEANGKTNDEIIILSDSDDSVILLPSPAPVVYSVDDSSDELDSTNLEHEHLDPDPSVATATKRSSAMPNISSPEIQNVCSSPETKQQSYDASPEICKTIHLETLVKPTEMSHKANEITEIERTELLFTPDSNTNDFIENDVDILNNRGSGFNFNLHGSDLDLNKLEKPSSHVARLDVYETESSCSEAGTITKIFTEVDFVLPTKEIFCEPDLASFSKFITPTRKEIAPDLVLNLECTSVKSKAFKKTQHSQHSENDNLLSDNEYNSDATSLVIKKKSKNKKKKDKRNQLEDEASKIFQNIGDSFNRETEVVQQNKKDKRKKSDEETNEIMYNANENVTLKKANTRKKSNDEACEQAEIISHNPFNNETENAQKKKNKRKKIDKEICEQTGDLQDLNKSENTQLKKKDKRKKLDDVEICEQIDSPTSSNNDTDIVTKRKKEKRKNVDEETSGLFESSTHLNNATEIATQKKKEKRKKVDEKTGEQTTESLINSNMETKIVTQKKKEKRKKLDEETCEQIDPSNSNNETENVIQKKKNKRKKQEDETNSEPSSDIVDNYQQNTIKKVQIKKKDKRKKFDDKDCLQIETIVTNPNPIENETVHVHTQKKENRKIFDDRATRKRIEFIVNNSLSSETQNAPQKKKDKRKKMEDETTSEQIENKIKTSRIESVIENPSQESKPIAEHRHEIGSIKIECDTAMKNLDDNVVQPNNKVNFSFMSAWNQIPPSTFRYSKETIGNDEESIVKNLNETLTLPDSPQIANTFGSKPIIDDLKFLTTTLQILKKPYHSPKLSETKVSESLKLLSSKVSEVNTKIISDSLKDSIPTSKKSQIPINIDLKGSVAEQRHEIDSIKIECDTAMKSMDENVVQPNNKVNFSFMSAWNQIQPSTFQYSKETIGNAQEFIVKTLNETLTLPDSPQIANTFDSKPIEDDLEILTTTPQILKDSYHSLKDSETKVSDSLKLLSPIVSEVNTKTASECLKDSNPTSKKSQTPINIELEGSAGSGNSKESSKILIKGFQQISKVVKDNVLESSIDALESKTKKGTEILEDFSHQITLPNPISKEAPKISKTPELIKKKILSQSSQQCDTAEMPKALDSRSKRILSQASKEIPQTSRQSPPIAEVSQIPKTPDNKTKKHLSHASKEVPQTLTKPSLISEIPLALKSKIQTFIFQTFKESTQTAIPKTLNLPHSSKKSPPIIDISEVDYIPISLQTDSKMNPKHASTKISTNILLNISPPKQSTSKVSDKKLVANPFSFTDSDRKTFSDFWTDDMKKFYEESWGQENYDIDMVLKSMPSDESKWKIIVEDKFRSRSPRTRGPACQKCREVGHSKYHCTRYPGPLKCAICGASGHFHARCPNLMCTSCGNQGGYFTTSCSKCAHYKNIICSLCNSIGHHNTKCPDLWRRYHLTTEDLPTLNSTISKLKPNNKRWCSNCARRGHLQNVCTYMNTEHFTTMPHIISYDPCYNRIFNISPAAQPENIPTMFENTNLSQIRDYKNKMFEFNKERYLHLLKILKRQCRSSGLPYIPDIEKMERALQRDQNPKHIIGNIYKLRSLIQKGNMWK